MEVYDADWYTLPSLPAVTGGVTTFQLESGSDYEARMASLLRHVEHIYEALEGCLYACGLDGEHRSQLDSDNGLDIPVSASSLEADRVEMVSWLMLFPPRLVAEYGRDWLLSAPAWERRELDDGAVLVVAYGDPHDRDRKQYNAVAEHVGLAAY